MKNPKESPCVSVEYGYTSDEVREAVEHIKRVRLSKKLAESFQDSSPFTVTFIGDGLTTDKIRLRKYVLSEQDVKNASAPNPGYEQHTAGGVYTEQPGIKINGVTHNSGFAVDIFKLHSGVDTNIEALIENSVKNHVQSAVRDIKKHLTADRMTMADLTSHIKQVMLLECFPDGILHRNFGRR